MNQPAPGSKPAPCTPGESRERAKQKADEAEITLSRFHAMYRAIGATHFALASHNEGTTVTLKGSHKGRTAVVEVLCPKGHPVVLHCMQALEEFRLGLGKEPKYGHRDVRMGRVDEPDLSPEGEARWQAQQLAEVERKIEETRHLLRNGTQGSPLRGAIDVSIDALPSGWDTTKPDMLESLQEAGLTPSANPEEVPGSAPPIAGRVDAYDARVDAAKASRIADRVGAHKADLVSRRPKDNTRMNPDVKAAEAAAAIKVDAERQAKIHEETAADNTERFERQRATRQGLLDTAKADRDAHRKANDAKRTAAFQERLSDATAFEALRQQPLKPPSTHGQAAFEQAAEAAAVLKKRSEAMVMHGNIRKAPAAGAGQRKVLSLPLCIQCKAQPVYGVGAEFCGGACAKQHHMKKIATMKGITLS